MTQHEMAGPRWRRYAAEVVTIIVGILLALAADAGRQYLADRGTEREMLAALRVEFAVDVREIDADQKARANKLAAIELLSAARADATRMPSPEELAAAVLSNLNWRYYTASHPVLDDLLTTGRLDLLRSSELRRAILAFQQERSRIGVTEEQEREFVMRQVAPYLAARLDLEALSSPRSPAQHAAALRAIPGVLAEASFGSLLFLNRDRTENSTRFADKLLETVTAVQKLLGEKGGVP